MEQLLLFIPLLFLAAAFVLSAYSALRESAPVRRTVILRISGDMSANVEYLLMRTLITAERAGDVRRIVIDDTAADEETMRICGLFARDNGIFAPKRQ